MSTVDVNDATAIDTVTKGIDKVDISSHNDNNNTSEVIQETCANCGKEGNSEDMNMCNKCKSGKYCNAACKKKHRKKHKKECERRVAELHDKKLFKEPPPPDECSICMLSMPIKANQTTFKTCCGKRICNGCIYAMDMSMSEGENICAFCRTPTPSSEEEEIKRGKKLMDKECGWVFHFMAGRYDQGYGDLTQDHQQANELYLKAGELGCAGGYYHLGHSYRIGRGVVERDMGQVKHYWELAAMGGHVLARHLLGEMEGMAGNHQRAMAHFMISARGGCKESLDSVQTGFMDGVVTKDVYASTLRAYHERQKAMKSDARDQAALSRRG